MVLLLTVATTAVWGIVRLRLDAEHRAEAAADDLADAAAATLDTWIQLEVARLRTVARTQLRGPVSDAVLSAAVAPLERPFALVLDPASPSVLAAHPQRELDAETLFVDHAHLRRAAAGSVGVRTIAMSEGRHGVAIAVPFTDHSGRARILSSVDSLEPDGPDDRGGGVGAQLAALAGLEGSHVELHDEAGQVLLRPTPGPPPGGPSSSARAASGHVVVATVAPVGDGHMPLWTSLVLVTIATAAVGGAVGSIARAAGAAEHASSEAAGLARTRADFVAIVSHEIRTPIVIMNGMLDTALGDEMDMDDATRLDLLRRARRAAARLDRLTSDIMTSTLAEQGRIEAVLRDVDLADVVADAVANSRMAEDRRLELEPVEHIRVTTDPGLVSHVIANLLDNAAKYGDPPVVVRTARRPSAVDVEVIDHGVGLTDEQMAFAPYGQTGVVMTRRDGGLGLGLHLARTLAGALHGELVYVREQGRTVFRLTLPLHAAPAATEIAG